MLNFLALALIYAISLHSSFYGLKLVKKALVLEEMSPFIWGFLLCNLAGMALFGFYYLDFHGHL